MTYKLFCFLSQPLESHAFVVVLSVTVVTSNPFPFLTIYVNTTTHEAVIGVFVFI